MADFMIDTASLLDSLELACLRPPPWRPAAERPPYDLSRSVA